MTELVRIHASCRPGEAVTVAHAELRAFGEGHYPGQVRCEIRNGRRWHEVLVSPDRIGKCQAQHYGGVFSSEIWARAEDREDAERTALSVLEEALRAYAGKIEASLAAVAAALQGEAPTPKP